MVILLSSKLLEPDNTSRSRSLKLIKLKWIKRKEIVFINLKKVLKPARIAQFYWKIKIKIDSIL